MRWNVLEHSARFFKSCFLSISDTTEHRISSGKEVIELIIVHKSE